MKFLILNGPNVNLQRYSEPGMPGELDYNGMMDYVQSGCDQMGIETDVCQTNHEGDLIDEIQAAAGRVDGIVLNPGGYAHTSVAILDALRLCGVPAVEVLLTAPDEREPFRKIDVVSFGCQGHFIGQGPQGYLHACAYLAQLLRLDGTPPSPYRDVKNEPSQSPAATAPPRGELFCPGHAIKPPPSGEVASRSDDGEGFIKQERNNLP